MYLTLKNTLFSLIPGANVANWIYLGLIVWLIAIFMTNRKWGAFMITFIVGAIIKAVDHFVFGQAASTMINELAHMAVLPLILTLVNGRASKLG